MNYGLNRLLLLKVRDQNSALESESGRTWKQMSCNGQIYRWLHDRLLCLAVRLSGRSSVPSGKCRLTLQYYTALSFIFLTFHSSKNVQQRSQNNGEKRLLISVPSCLLCLFVFLYVWDNSTDVCIIFVLRIFTKNVYIELNCG